MRSPALQESSGSAVSRVLNNAAELQKKVPEKSVALRILVTLRHCVQIL